MPHNCLNIEGLMKKRPKIGISSRLNENKKQFYIGRDYCEALEHFGALPVIIPLIPKREYLSEIIISLDGILLPGSDTDVDPNLYGEHPHPRLKKVVPEKDETDLLLLDEAEKSNLPILAICFGMQVLNVSRGGTLYQDIETQIPNCIKHRQGTPLDRNSHQITFTDAPNLITRFVPPEDFKDVKVNSHHHQAIKLIGKDLQATSFAADGVVESFEDTRENRFVLGVEWHPEHSYRKDVLSKEIFKAFVDFCAR